MTTAPKQPVAHLMEPYRSAIVALGLNEGLVGESEPGIASHSKSVQAGSSRLLQLEVLQLLLLYQDVTVQWSGAWKDESLARHKPVGFEMTGLETSQVVRLVKPSDLPDPQRDARTPKGSWALINKVWKTPLREDLVMFKPFILSQLKARGKPISPELYDVFIEARFGDIVRASQLVNSVPSDQQEVAVMVAGGTKTGLKLVDLPIHSELYACQFATECDQEEPVQVIAAPFIEREGGPTDSMSTPASAQRIVSIVADELLDYGFELPVPTTLAEAVKLRGNPAMGDFREVFFPWLERIATGDKKEEQLLRREVKKALRGLQSLGAVRRLTTFTSHAGVTLDVLELLQSIPGVGSIVGLANAALSQLTKRMERRSKWVLMATDGAKPKGLV